MDFNICIVRPPGYIHSAAFAELAELIAYGLQDLRHNVRVTTNQIAGNATNIIIGVHLLNPQQVPALPGSSIILNTEQVWGDIPSEWKERIFSASRQLETWDYSQLNIDKFRRIGAKNCKHLKIGYHERLRRLAKPSTQDIDVLFYGAIIERREKVFEALLAAGLKIRVVFGAYGRERDALIERSKIVLNLHQFDSKIFEIVRVFYLLSNSKAVVAEVGPETHMEPCYVDGICAATYERLVESCIALAADDERREGLEAAALATIKKLPQAELLAPLVG
jgi:hypothetical protein